MFRYGIAGLFRGSGSKQKKQKKALKQERKSLESERRRAGEYPEAMQNNANRLADSYRQQREEGRQRGQQYAQEVLNRPMQGLAPEQRLRMQEGFQGRLNQDLQGYERRLLGEQGRRGIRGGAAYAQRADLARAGVNAQREYQRDVGELDSDIALKKLAASFGIEQGEAAQTQLDRQLAMDELRLDAERKRQRGLEDQYSRLFRRV